VLVSTTTLPLPTGGPASAGDQRQAPGAGVPHSFLGQSLVRDDDGVQPPPRPQLAEVVDGQRAAPPDPEIGEGALAAQSPEIVTAPVAETSAPPGQRGGAVDWGKRAVAFAMVVAVLLAGVRFLRRREFLAAFDSTAIRSALLGESPGRNRIRARARAAAFVVVALAISALLVQVGKLALYRPQLAVVLACATLAVILAATDPLALAAFAVLGVWIVERVSAGGIDISGSDTLLAIGAIGALPFVPWQNPHVRRVITAIVAFEAVLFVTVLVHPTVRGLFEWGHRLFLTGGGVVVGAALAHHGRSRAVLRAFLVVSSVIGAMAVVLSAANGFAHAEVLHYQKNFAGSLMVMSLAIAYLAPRSAGLSNAGLVVVKILCVLGILGFQSRGAIVALVAGLLFAAARSRDVRRRALPAMLILVPLTAFAFLSLDAQLERQREFGTSSITERDRYREQAIEAWRAAPAFGQGMRFFKSGDFALPTDPHNIIVASLSETGVVGLLALVVLLTTTYRVTACVASPLALAACAILVIRFTHGLFDVFWVAGTQVLPWMIVGMALAEQAGTRSGPEERPHYSSVGTAAAVTAGA
jgi:hypothetical protein